MSLLVVGSVALDSVETPFAKRDDILGGSASYFAAVASLLTPTRVVAVVGEDFPEEHLAFLRERGNDLDGISRAKGKTFHWAGRYLENMVDRETLDTQLNVFEHFDPVLPDAYRDSRYVFLANIMPALQRKVLDQIESAEFVAIDTMNFWLVEPHREVLIDVLSRCQVAFLNDEEARLLSGEHNLVKAAQAVRKLGLPHVIIKRGDAGAMLFDDEGIFWAPALPLTHVADPTGAGDSFAGGFMSYLARSGDTSPKGLRQAMIVGSATGSFACEDFSVDRFRTLKTEELLKRCAAFDDLVSFEPIAL